MNQVGVLVQAFVEVHCVHVCVRLYESKHSEPQFTKIIVFSLSISINFMMDYGLPKKILERHLFCQKEPVKLIELRSYFFYMQLGNSRVDYFLSQTTWVEI